jgi:acetylornithine deacetylase/succinyl-diaminopimelate desuccinylase family protein
MPLLSRRARRCASRMASLHRAAEHVDAGRVAHLASRLVAADSVNPMLVSGASGEHAVALLIADECRSFGLEVRIDEIAPRRFNATARLSGGRPGRRLMMNGHIDTVDVDAMRAAGRDPFSGRIDGRRLYGRGAYDMKGSAAAMVEAARALAAVGLEAGELVLTFVADEEYASIGTADIVHRMRSDGRPDAAIVVEPTELEVCIAHKGFVWARVTTTGQAAHGSLYDAGDDAIVRMGHVLVALNHLDRTTLAAKSHPLLGRASVHASTIRGGLGLSTYPDRCDVEIERRTLPGESDRAVMAELTGLLDSARAASPGLSGRAEMMLSRPPFAVDADAPIVRAVVASAEVVRGHRPEIVGRAAWFDAALLGAAGVPTVMFGPSGEGAHAADEWVDLDSVTQCAQTLADVAARYCPGP